MKKKMMAAILVAVSLVGSAMNVSAKNVSDFSDVKKGDWFYETVKDISEKELMTGLNSTTFGPSELLGRAQFACVLYRMEGSPDVAYKNIYPDAPNGQFYSQAVTWASEADVIRGYNNGKFGVADNITREQLVTIMYRYAKENGREDISERASLDKYPDGSKVSAFAKEAMEWAVATGVLRGEGSNGSLNPQGNVGRAVCATIISRFTEEPEHEHVWVEQTHTVYHEATGHEEEYVVEEAWDEEVETPVYEMDEREICNTCGEDLTELTEEEMWNQHIIGLHGGGGWHSEWVKIQTGTTTEIVHHDAVYDTKWVEDTPAYDEVVSDGYKCSECGARK